MTTRKLEPRWTELNWIPNKSPENWYIGKWSQDTMKTLLKPVDDSRIDDESDRTKWLEHECIASHRIYRISHQKTSDIGKWLVPSMTNQTGGMHHMWKLRRAAGNSRCKQRSISEDNKKWLSNKRTGENFNRSQCRIRELKGEITIWYNVNQGWTR